MEELRELNNEEDYEVPVDFKEKVLMQINRKETSSKIKHIIPVCSAAAILVLAIFIAIAPKLDKSMTSNSEETEFNALSAQGLKSSYNNYVEEATNDVAEYYNYERSAVISADSVSAEKKQAITSEYNDEIIDVLKINNIEAEKMDGYVRAKGKKEDIEMALYYFEDNVEIKQDGEYIIIKGK